MFELKIVNRKLQWSDGQPAIFAWADSPESRLKDSYQAAFKIESEALAQIGINCITATLRGDDVTDITPWINNNPNNGVDTAKLTRWKNQLKYFLDQCAAHGIRAVVVLYLGERTNWKSISLAKYKEWIDAMAPIFSEIQGQCIFGIEEIGEGNVSAGVTFMNPVFSYLKTKLPKCLTMLHNNPGEKPWNYDSNADIMCIQEKDDINRMGASGIEAFNKGYAVMLHEYYPGFNGSESSNLTLLGKFLNQAKTQSSGWGIFDVSYPDGGSPNVSKHRNLYKALVNGLGGTTPEPPNPTTMIIILGTNSTITPTGNDLNGKTFAPNTDQYIWLSGAQSEVSGSIDFYLDNVKVKTENQYPYAYAGDTTGKAHPAKFTAGTHKIEARKGTQVIATATFTVGTGTPTPIPGCTNPQATNYNPNATVDDGSCQFDTETPRVDITIEKTAGVDVYVNGVKI